MSNDTEKDALTRRGFLGVGSAALAAAGMLAGEKLAAQEQAPYQQKSNRSSSDPGPTNPTIDAANPDKLKKLSTYVKRRKLEFHAISAVTGQGIEELKWALARRLQPEAAE